MAKTNVDLIISAQDKTGPAFNKVQKHYQDMQAGLRELAEGASKISGTGKKAQAEIAALEAKFRGGVKGSQEALKKLMDELARKMDAGTKSMDKNVQKVAALEKELGRLGRHKASIDRITEGHKASAEAAGKARVAEAKRLDDAKRKADAALASNEKLRAEMEKSLKVAREASQRKTDTAKALQERSRELAQNKALSDAARARVEEQKAITKAETDPNRKAAAAARLKALQDEAKAAAKLTQDAARRQKSAEVRSTSASTAAATSVASVREARSAAAGTREAINRIQVQRQLITKQIEDNGKLTNSELAYARARKLTDNVGGQISSGEMHKRRLIDLNERLKAQEDSLRATYTRAGRVNSIGDGLNARTLQQNITRGQNQPANVSRYDSGYDRMAKAAFGGPSMRSAAGDAQTLEKAIGAISHKFLGLATAYTLFHGALNQVGKIIETFRAIQAFESRMNFSNAGDMNKTARDLDYVRKSAEKYGIQIKDLTENYSKFSIAATMSGLSSKTTKEVFDGLNAVARVNKLTPENINRASYAIQQMLSKGTVSAEEARQQFGEAIPGGIQLIAEAAGYGAHEMDKFQKAMEMGQLKSAEIVPKLGRLLTEKYGPSVELAARSFEAQLARFYNAIFEAREAFAKSGFMEGLTDGMVELTKFFKSNDGQIWFQQLGSSIGGALKLAAELAQFLPLIMGAGTAAIAVKLTNLTAASIQSSMSMIAAQKAATAAASGAGAASVGGGARAGIAGMAALFGGLPGLIAGATIGLGLFLHQRHAKEAEEQRQKIAGVATSIRDVRIAAQEANGDVKAFGEALKDIKDLDSDLKRTAARAVQAGAMTAARQRLVSLSGDMARFSRSGSDIMSGSYKELQNEAMGLANAFMRGEMTLEDFNKKIDEFAKKTGADPEMAIGVQNAAAAAKSAEKDMSDLLDVTQAMEKGGDALGDVMNSMAKATEDTTRKIAAQEKAIAAITSTIGQMATEGSELKRTLDFEDAFAKLTANSQTLHQQLKDVFDPAQYARLADRIATSVNQNLAKITADFMNPILEKMGIAVQLAPEAAAALMERQGLSAGPIGSSYGYTGSGSGSSGSVETIDGSKIYAKDPVLKGLNDIEVALLNGIAARESQGFYNVRYGGTTGKQYFPETGAHPNVRERTPDGKISTASGRYQFVKSTWDSRTGNAPFTRENQDREALRYAKEVYQTRTGKDLISELSAKGMTEEIMDKLSGTWEAFTNPGMRKDSRAEFNATLARRRSMTVEQGIEPSRPLASGNNSDPVSVNVVAAEIPALRDVAGRSAVENATVAPASDFIGPMQPNIQATLTGVPELTVTNMDIAVQQQAQAERALSGTEFTNVLGSLQTAINSFPPSFQQTVQVAIAKMSDEQQAALAQNLDFATEVKQADGDIEKLVAALEKAGFEDIGDALRAQASGAFAGARTDRISDSRVAVADWRKEDLSKAYASDDLLKEGVMSAAVEREVNEVAAKLTENGATLAEAMGVASDMTARELLRGEARLAARTAEQKQLAAKAEKDAEDIAKFQTNARKELERSREEAALEAMPAGSEKDRAKAEFDVRKMEIAGGEGFEIDPETRAQMVAYKYEQLQVETNKRITADLGARLDATLSSQQAKLDDLKDQLGDAKETGNTAAVADLTEQIRLQEEAWRKALQAKIDYNTQVGEPVNLEQNESLELQRAQFERNTQSITDYQTTLQGTADLIAGPIVSAFQGMAQAIADGESVWDSLKMAIGQAVAQILIDLGMMIIKAVVTQMVLAALGIPMPAGGAMANTMGSFLSGAVPQFHDGGVVGGPSVMRNLEDVFTGKIRSNERITILEEGEEVLTRKDPRHRGNLGIRKYHTGGIVGFSADNASSSLASLETGAAKSGEMFKNKESSKKEGGNVRNVIVLDQTEMLKEAMSGPAGETIMVEWISKNKKKVRGVLGV